MGVTTGERLGATTGERAALMADGKGLAALAAGLVTTPLFAFEAKGATTGHRLETTFGERFELMTPGHIGLMVLACLM